MKSYTDIGLTSNLISVDSLAVRVDNQEQSITSLVSDIVQELNPQSSKKTFLESINFIHAGTTSFERWYIANKVTTGSLITGALTDNSLFASPFFSSRGGIVDRIGMNITGATANGTIRMGIYQATNTKNLYPNKLILDAGTFSGATTGMKIGTINVTFQPNTLYYLVSVSNDGGGTLTVRGFT